MITDVDIMEIVNEIHLYSTVVIETGDESLYGIYKAGGDRVLYFRLGRFGLRRSTRLELTEKLAKGLRVEGIHTVTFHDFISSMSGKKPTHIWLELQSPTRREMGFVSIRELKNYLRTLH